MNYKLYIIGLGALLLAGCKDADELSAGGSGQPAGNVIQVGGIDVDEMVAHASVTRDGDPAPVDEETVVRTDAENIEWLRSPLFSGLDITYGNFDKNTGGRINPRVAILKLLSGSGTNGIKYSDGGLAEYSFLYRDNATGNPTTTEAIWYDNGSHFFEGLYVPSDISYNATSQTVDNVYGDGGTALNLTTDQHDDATTEDALGNYTRLAHYLAMPSNYTLNATVARVKLPFRHRLARVLAYILIDPEMGDDVKINGYTYTPKVGDTPAVLDDPTDTDIRFCKVKVLAGVKDAVSSQHHTYTPQWTEIRKVIPHFVGERGSYNDATNTSLDANHFIAYYNKTKKVHINPTDAEWAGLASKFDPVTAETPKGTVTSSTDPDYQRTVYGQVPVYDLIVRPTYRQLNRVMYDEEGYDNATTRTALYNNTNKIEFEITLNNGLVYSREVEIDLDANYQTAIYLRISREHVDYSSSGSQLWQETTGYDGYYGVNNENGNTLSVAGSSWQRAYTNDAVDYGITDGHKYQGDTEDEYAQHVSDARWIEMLREACVGGKHHGDYFILKSDISIPAAAFPADFVFTGHLDGLDHTITLTNEDYLFAGLNGHYTTAQESDASAEWEANVHKETHSGNTYWVPYRTATDGWRAEVINLNINSGATLFKAGAGYSNDGGTDVTGYVHNCWVGATYNNSTHQWSGGTAVKENKPTIPQY